jgi:hypothetical protein
LGGFAATSRADTIIYDSFSNAVPAYLENTTADQVQTPGDAWNVSGGYGRARVGHPGAIEPGDAAASWRVPLACQEHIERRNMKSLITAAVALAATLLFISSAHGNIIYPANNGFESPDLGSGGGALIYAPTNASWTFYSAGMPGQGGSGIAANNSAFDVENASPDNHDGTMSTEGQAAFIQGGNGTTIAGTPDASSDYASYISQTINGFAAGTASVSFGIEARVENGTNSNPTAVYLDDQLLGIYTATDTSNFDAMVTTPIPVTAGSHILAFVGTVSQPGASQFIDDVSIDNEPVPEPTGAGLLAISGFTALFCCLRRPVKFKSAGEPQ